jgi:predicted AAA+ superfamily ATPase
MNLGFSFSSNFGKLLENLVFSEFLKKGYEVFFYNKDTECDFILRKDNKIIAVQVCYVLNDKNWLRELNGFEKLPFMGDEKFIIT